MSIAASSSFSALPAALAAASFSSSGLILPPSATLPTPHTYIPPCLPICTLCCVAGALLPCSSCHRPFHASCMPLAAPPNASTCSSCAQRLATCSSCNACVPVADLTPCLAPRCSRLYHAACATGGPFPDLICPAHTCTHCGVAQVTHATPDDVAATCVAACPSLHLQVALAAAQRLSFNATCIASPTRLHSYASNVVPPVARGLVHRVALREACVASMAILPTLTGGDEVALKRGMEYLMQALVVGCSERDITCTRRVKGGLTVRMKMRVNMAAWGDAFHDECAWARLEGAMLPAAGRSSAAAVGQGYIR